MKPSVLIVEDDRLVARMLEKFLRAKGFDVSIAHGGHDAWNRLSCNDPPPVAVIDWSIHEIDGGELCRRVRERVDAPFTYLVLMSGRFARYRSLAGPYLGADECIAKPFRVEQVIEAVERGMGVARDRRGGTSP